MPNDERFDEYLSMIGPAYGGMAPAEGTGGDFPPLPAGQYDCKILQVIGKVSRNQNPMLEWTLEVLSPIGFKGRRIWRVSMLTQQGIPYLKKDLQILGMSWFNDAAALKDRLGELRGLLVEVAHVGVTGPDGKPERDQKGKERRQTYLNKRIEQTDWTPVDPPHSADPPSEDIPF